MNKVTLSAAVDIISGGTPKTTVKEYWDEGTVGWLSVTDFNNDLRYVYNSEKKITVAGLKNSNAELLQKGDLIISARGTVGALAQIGIPMSFNQSCFGLRGKSGILDNDFLYYCLKNYVLNIKKRSQGSVFDTINLDSFDLMEIDIPNFPYQKKIASVLSALDSKIELNNRINSELEAMAKTLYDYWFVQFDFPNEKGTPYKSSGGKMVWNEELKREIPDKWVVSKVGDLLQTSLGGTPSTKVEEYWQDGSINWLNSGEIASFPVVTSELKITEVAISHSATELLPKGSVLLSITRHLRPTILGIDACVNQSVVGIKEKGEIKNCFLYPYLKNEIPRLLSLRTGAQQPHINKDTVDESLILMPSENSNILKLYNSKASHLYELIINHAKENLLIMETRDWLLPMLMNGQVSISENTREGLKDKEKLSSRNEPSIKKETSASEVVYFRSIVPRREERYVNCVPSLDLEIAAGTFGEDQRPNFNEWVEINTSRPLKKGMFVAKVVGRSMEPLIPDGAHCLFLRKAPQLRNDMIAVFQLHDSEDPESGGHYTVKRLRVYRQNTDEGVVRKAKLMPENPAFQPITVDEDNVKFVAEFLEVLQPLVQ